MVENSRKRQGEIKGKIQVDKEYTFKPKLNSINTNVMVENSRKRAAEYAFKKRMNQGRQQMTSEQGSEKELKPLKKPKDFIFGPERIPVDKKNQSTSILVS